MLCILAAAFIWVLNSLNNPYTAKISYPVVFDYDRSEYIPVEKLPRRIEMNVSGNGWNILRKTFWFNIEPVEIYLSEPLQSRTIATTALISNFDLEFQDIDINYFIDDSLFLDFQPIIEVNMPVVLDTPANLVVQGFVLASPISIRPDTITLLGAASYIDSIGLRYPLRIPERNLDEDYDEQVTLEAHDERYVTTGVKEVNLSFKVEKLVSIGREISPTLENFPTDSSIFIRPSTVRLDFSIREGLVDALADSLFEVSVDLRKMDRKDSTVQVNLVSKPPFVDSVQMMPGYLEVVKVRRK